ncbi:MAG: Gfo/Idh/MocA family oxidoreductase [Chloroflexi bacterium]|nr:Gfo/Idh/MocA family oxidoreductase [Chloroflexota bacterium]
MTLRFGLVGLGRWGAVHAAAIRATPGAELAAVAVSDEASARRAEAELGVPAFADDRAMLAQPDLRLDVVDVVAPNAAHAGAALAALEAGCHVLVEKPLATTRAGCDAILETARRCGKVVGVGHELRLSPLWGRVKQEIERGRIGRPRACTITLWRRSFRPGSRGWRHDPARVGSWLLEEPVHWFDLACWYLASLGPPTAVYARGNSGEASRPLDENVAALVSFPDGGFATITQTTAGAEHHLIAQVMGSEGAIRVVWDGASDRSETPTFRIELAIADMCEELRADGVPTEAGDLEREIAQFVRAIERGESPATSAEDGRAAVLLCLAAEESIRTGREVRL